MNHPLKKIVLFGPESTGKTLLAKKLADHYHTLWVPEFARSYLENKFSFLSQDHKLNDEICEENDIPSIVLGQVATEDAFIDQSNKILFFDTNPLQTAVYVQYYYQKQYDWLEKIVDSRTYDHYLLLDIDVEWQPDPLRDRPNDRQNLLNQFEKMLLNKNQDYTLIGGLDHTRLQEAISVIDSLTK